MTTPTKANDFPIQKRQVVVGSQLLEIQVRVANEATWHVTQSHIDPRAARVREHYLQHQYSLLALAHDDDDDAVTTAFAAGSSGWRDDD
jgi:hypothetical protein